MTRKSTNTARPPAGLSKRGRAFWRQTSTDYELSDAETRLLEEVCRCLDRLDTLDAQIAAAGPMVTGSQGQAVLNPAFAEARQQQIVLHRLISALDLPDEDGGDGVLSAQQVRSRTANRAQWREQGTEAARRRNLGIV